MATENKKYIPALRFPEFQNNGEWILTPVGKYYKVQGGFAFRSSEFKKSGTPIIRISNIPNEGIYIDISNSVYYDRIENEVNFLISKGDLLIAMSGATTGKTAVYNQIGKAYLNQRVGLFKSINSNNYYPFICQWVKSNYFYAQLKRTLAAGAQPNISSKDIESFIWAYPNGNNSFAEQKKIADCLSSLDKFIDATKRKLELLKEHKKGLMQCLFPAKGKTTPELRFPEFIGTKEWTPTQLGAIGETFGGLSGKSAEDFGIGKPFVTYKQVFNSSEIDSSECALVQVSENETQNKLQYGDVLVTMSSETPDEVGYTAVVTNKNIPECYLNSFCFIYRLFDNESIDAKFLIYLFSSDVYRTAVVRIAQGITRFNIAKTKFKEIDLSIPETKEEQRKIANTLSAIDKQITEYDKKIKALELHKKGLMQQLFPKL